jgi:hypothetical protein
MLYVSVYVHTVYKSSCNTRHTLLKKFKFTNNDWADFLLLVADGNSFHGINENSVKNKTFIFNSAPEKGAARRHCE